MALNKANKTFGGIGECPNLRMMSCFFIYFIWGLGHILATFPRTLILKKKIAEINIE